MKKVMVTGGSGFVGTHLVSELLNHGYFVINIDNYSKYGPTKRQFDQHENYRMYQMDARDIEREFNSNSRNDDFVAQVKDIECIVNLAAMLGGIEFFHKYAFDLMATNEEILASVFRLAIRLNKDFNLKRIVQMSSSMVYESCPAPNKEGDELKYPVAKSVYGFQKMASEFFCKGALEQYGLPYTIVRAFNCVGKYEDKEKGLVDSNTNKMNLAHVVPDLINRALQLQPEDKLPILGAGNQVRCYTNGRDIARGIRLAMESDAAINNDFNISTPTPTSVTELATKIWRKIHGCDPAFEHMEPFKYDVQVRRPSVQKAKELLGFEAEISLDESLDEVIEYIKATQMLVK